MLLATKNSKYLRLKNCDSAPIPFRAENNSAVCGTIKPVGVHCSCLGQVFGSNGLMIILIIVNCCSLPAVSQPFNIFFLRFAAPNYTKPYVDGVLRPVLLWS